MFLLQLKSFRSLGPPSHAVLPLEKHEWRETAAQQREEGKTPAGAETIEERLDESDASGARAASVEVVLFEFERPERQYGPNDCA